ncbi:cation diffusion facilitator family transporter [uncultured Methylovirgula sp.]|uniref:cation diffusion facilitator family transporter n=1 Tax=uncultured Methylovirgula sp. TaxID=1285960 RepID=UPI002611407A|nr:cation diffusion facilitator family transporter [uncultured Methylovirgula sp.]
MTGQNPTHDHHDVHDDDHEHHDHDHETHDDHGHADGHHHHGIGGHSHAPVSFGRAFAIGMALNTIYILAEVFYGVAAHSLALLADAGHNLGDVVGLGGAWLAASLIRRHPTSRYTYGWGAASILAALGNAVLLLVVTGGIGWEAIRRLIAPEPAAGTTIMAVSAVGIVVNGATALLFAAGRKGDLNIKGAFMHMAADAVLAFGVVVAGGLILLTGWQWIDPAVSLVVSMAIVAGTWSLLRDSVNLSLNAVPPGIEQAAVQSFLDGLPGVTEVHDLHIWGLATTETALTAHLVLVDGADHESLLRWLPGALNERFKIGHCTVQLESFETARICALRPAHVV